MMPELSLNILDIAQNSISAGAGLIEILVQADTINDTLTILIRDNGCGMSEEQVSRSTDPFFTTRTTRKVGLGVPFFKLAAESTGGEFHIDSSVGVGTTITAVFGLSHIDRMPLGDMISTIHTLIIMNEAIDFVYTFTVDDRSFTLDTRQFRQVLGDVPFRVPDVSQYIRDYLSENEMEVRQGITI